MAFRQAFGRRLYLWEFAHFIEYGLEGGDKGSLPAGERRVLDTAFERVAGHLDSRPRVLNHRDYHSWNLMVPDDDAVVVIDFQDALLAPPQYDLASLLNDRETDQVVTPSVEDQLVDYYLEGMRRMGRDPRPDRDAVPGGLPAVGPTAGLQGRRDVSGTWTWSRANPRYQQVHRSDTLKTDRAEPQRGRPGLGHLIPLLAERFEEIA